MVQEKSAGHKSFVKRIQAKNNRVKRKRKEERGGGREGGREKFSTHKSLMFCPICQVQWTIKIEITLKVKQIHFISVSPPPFSSSLSPSLFYLSLVLLSYFILLRILFIFLFWILWNFTSIKIFNKIFSQKIIGET